MMQPLLNAMRLQAQRTGERTISRYATVQSYDPNRYAAKVLLQPENTETGFLPVASPWIGNGWGFFAPPSANDLVIVHFIDGDLEAGIVETRQFNNAELPVAVQSGEFWLLHKSGAYFKLTNAGAATFSDGQGATITLQGGNITSAANQWNHTGPMHVTGSGVFTGTVTAQDIVTQILTSLNTHIHSGVQTGGSNTGGPTG
ncbi:MAG: phage baseplate assembly protein V [Patescibacteria group bacterium]|nr:phage baseplate assembly protein V [Patescibacteria group bacterium]